LRLARTYWKKYLGVSETLYVKLLNCLDQRDIPPGRGGGVFQGLPLLTPGTGKKKALVGHKKAIAVGQVRQRDHHPGGGRRSSAKGGCACQKRGGFERERRLNLPGAVVCLRELWLSGGGSGLAISGQSEGILIPSTRLYSGRTKIRNESTEKYSLFRKKILLPKRYPSLPRSAGEVKGPFPERRGKSNLPEENPFHSRKKPERGKMNCLFLEKPGGLYLWRGGVGKKKGSKRYLREKKTPR